MEQLRGYFSSYLIVAAVMTPIAGKMSDLYGKKKVLLVLLTLYVAGITAGVFSNNISFLLASRIIQGVGLAVYLLHSAFLGIHFHQKNLP